MYVGNKATFYTGTGSLISASCINANVSLERKRFLFFFYEYHPLR